MRKKFDAVKMMRSIREELVERYLKTPEIELKELEKIREKYGIKGKEKDKQRSGIRRQVSVLDHKSKL